MKTNDGEKRSYRSEEHAANASGDKAVDEIYWKADRHTQYKQS